MGNSFNKRKGEPEAESLQEALRVQLEIALGIICQGVGEDFSRTPHLDYVVRGKKHPVGTE